MSPKILIVQCISLISINQYTSRKTNEFLVAVVTSETVWCSHKEVDDPSSVTHGILSLRSDAAGLENCAGRTEMGCESDGRRGESTEDLQFCFYFCICVVKSLVDHS